jgi:amino acid permease
MVADVLDKRSSSFLQTADNFAIVIDQQGLSVHEPARHASWLETSCTNVAEVIGIGVLGLPYTVSRLGWIWSIVLLLGVGLTNAISYLVLSAIIVKHPEARTWAEVGALVGPRTRTLVEIVVSTYLFSICIVDFLTCSNSLQQVIVGSGGSLCSYYCGLVVIGVMLPIAQIRSLHGLKHLVVLCILCIAVPVVWTLTVIISDTPKGTDTAGKYATSMGPVEGETATSTIAHVGTILFSYGTQFVQPDMMAEMTDPAEFRRVVWFTSPLIVGMYSAVAFTATPYGDCIEKEKDRMRSIEWYVTIASYCAVGLVVFIFCVWWEWEHLGRKWNWVP